VIVYRQVDELGVEMRRRDKNIVQLQEEAAALVYTRNPNPETRKPKTEIRSLKLEA
jgi:hypothetical protein